MNDISSILAANQRGLGLCGGVEFCDHFISGAVAVVGIPIIL